MKTRPKASPSLNEEEKSILKQRRVLGGYIDGMRGITDPREHIGKLIVHVNHSIHRPPVDVTTRNLKTQIYSEHKKITKNNKKRTRR